MYLIKKPETKEEEAAIFEAIIAEEIKKQSESNEGEFREFEL